MESRNPAQNRRSKTKWLGGLGLLLVSVGSKLKSILSLLKFGKFGATFFSMLVSVGAYALVFPWQTALGLVMMLFIHEMGHVWAARIKGLPVSAPAFIPFLGALIMMKKQPQDAKTEAFVAYGGPLLGTLGALVCFGLAQWTGYEPSGTFVVTNVRVKPSPPLGLGATSGISVTTIGEPAPMSSS